MKPFEILKNPLGLFTTELGFVAALIGCAVLWTRRTLVFLLITAPLFLTAAASAFHLYPLHSRLILFFVPPIIILVAEGAGEIAALSYWLSYYPYQYYAERFSFDMTCSSDYGKKASHRKSSGDLPETGDEAP